MNQQVQLPARFANRQRRTIATAVVTGLGSAAPPYVSLKGGAFTLIDANGEQEPVQGPLDCVIFDVNATVPIQRVFWGKDRPFDPNSDSYVAPLCFSDNGIGASANAQQPQSTNCQSCQWNVWGSATSKVTGKGVKACQAIKKVAVVVPGWDFPFLLRVPVMSHDNLRVYGDKFKGQDFDVSDVVTRVSFVHGQVGQIDFQATGFTDDETEALVQKLLDGKVTDGLIGRGDVVVQALAPPGVQQPPGSQPALQQPVQEPARPLAPPSGQAPQAPAAQPAGPFGTAQAPASASTTTSPTKRGRKPKAETPQSPFPQAAADDTGIPPFLRREAPAQQASSGIQANAPPPPAELEAQLQDIFKLKT